jgi:hypothetical protein
MTSVDDVERGDEVAARIRDKFSLRELYREIYARYADCLTRCPEEGLAVELGSGGGTAKEHLPDIVATDVLPLRWTGDGRSFRSGRILSRQGLTRYACISEPAHTR